MKLLISISLIHKANNGNKYARYLLLKYLPPNSAMAHKGVKLGQCGMILANAAINISPITK